MRYAFADNVLGPLVADGMLQIYMFRLLLEYGRVMDDNRDRIGYSGDGSELDNYDGVTPVDEIPH